LTPLFFDFYGIAGVQVNTAISSVAEFFMAEYAYHRVESLPDLEPRVIINFLDVATAGSHWSRHTHKILARWSYAIEFSENRVVLQVIGNRFSIPMIHHMLVHAALRYLVSFQNTLLFHSGAVATNGRSILFTGQGGVGKTTTTSLLLSQPEHRWALHADDYVFLKPGVGTMAYLTRSHLYLDLLSWVPGLDARLSLSEHIRLEFFGRVRSWSSDRIKWPVRLSLDRLWPENELCHQANPAALVLLKRGEVTQPNLAILQSGSEIVDGLIEMNFYEARHFQTLLKKNLSPSRADPLIASWREREKAILAAWVQQVPVYQLVLPIRHLPREQIANMVLQQISSLVRPGNGGSLG
jgi:hypothetical protein